jgi:hypothetical protein
MPPFNVYHRKRVISILRCDLGRRKDKMDEDSARSSYWLACSAVQLAQAFQQQQQNGGHTRNITPTTL